MNDRAVARFNCGRCGEPFSVREGEELETKAAAGAFSADRLDFTFEIKAVDADRRTIEGYAGVTGNLDQNDDIVEPGAYTRTLRELAEVEFRPLDAYIGHQHRIGSLPVGIPLEVREDEHGLFTRTRIHRSTAGDDLLAVARERLAAGKPLGMSIGYNAKDFKWEDKGGGRMIRRIKDLDLGEFSFTAMPANTMARVTAVKTANPEGQPFDPKREAATLATLAEHLEVKVGTRMKAEMRTMLGQMSEMLARLRSWADYEDERDDDEDDEDERENEGDKSEITSVDDAVAGLLELETAVATARGGR